MALYVRPLTEKEQAELENLESNAEIKPALQQRAQVILLSGRRLKVPDIAQEVALHPLNVRKWIHRFNKHGINGLHDKPRCGRPPKLDVQLRRMIWEIVATDPRALGHSYNTWTATRLMRYLEKTGLVEDVSYELVRQLFREAAVLLSADAISQQLVLSRGHAQRAPQTRPAFLAAGTT
ncbi:MAG: helix-turn-helix domain-containing protein [Chloroflexi bacterium]|nr:helix-turn-helix domain-containing protein [Chloroflexota bacterium]MBU1749514.1 helix-turn-helix domain-containing protein [Chloroflexota bacterium]